MNFKVKDHFYKKAKQENYLARSIYKLQEIDKRYKVLKKGDFVVDLGYFPGSWIQYTSKAIGSQGRVVGIDIQGPEKKLSNLQNVSLITKNIFEIYDINEIGFDKKIDVLLSDMAPSTTGIKSVDQNRSLELVEKVFEIAPVFLKPNGNMVVKAFEGHDMQLFLKEQKKLFNKFSFLRPKSTRSVSKEYFIIGQGYIGA